MPYLGGSGDILPQKKFANLPYSVLNLVIFLTKNDATLFKLLTTFVKHYESSKCNNDEMTPLFPNSCNTSCHIKGTAVI